MGESKNFATQYTDAQLREYWLDQDGALSFMITVEDELVRRGYTVRDEEGKPTRAHRPQSGDGPEGLKDLLKF